jgi:uncharacterized membrane protein YdcZ (DUF606 family)
MQEGHHPNQGLRMTTPGAVFVILLAVGVLALLADRSGLLGNQSTPITLFRIVAVVLVAAGAALFVSRR